MSISSSELESILAERLDLVRKEKALIRESIEELENKLRNARKLLGNNPRETDEQLTTAMQRLEFTHSTTSQSNADEREFMREMDKLRKKRTVLAAHLKTQSEVDELRNRLTELRKAQAGKDDSITELHQGLRKLKIANKVGCENNDIQERQLTVESSKISRIVGKGGANLRSIEDEHSVSIEIENMGGVVKIMGTNSGIDAAFQTIMTIVETSIEEFALSDEIIMCLMMEKAQRVNDIQAKYNVRLDISRSKNLCKISGLTDSVTAARTEITNLQSIRTDMLMEASAISAIIGKGGSSIIALQEEFHVAINVNRDRNTIEVVGLRSDVTAALTRIKDIIEINRDAEEVIQLEKHVLMGCFMTAGRLGLRTISKDNSVRIDCDIVKDNPLQSIKIKGNNGRVHAAKAQIVQVVGEYISNSLMFEVPDDTIPAILGKAGSGIKALREKHIGANIDIEGCAIHIQSSSIEQRLMIKQEIDEVVEANYSEQVDFEEENKIQLRSAQGVDTRTKLTKDLNVRLIIDATPTTVKVRGTRADVLRAVEALKDFKLAHTVEKVVLTEEDYPVLLNGKAKTGEDSLAKSLESQFNVEIRSVRKDLCLYISGHPEGVTSAKTAILGVLQGDSKCGSQLIDLHPLVLPSLIGKAGTNIAKMEAELGVKFDVLKNRNQLRIIGESAEKVITARIAVQRFIKTCRVVETIALSTLLSKKEVDAIVRRAAEIFQAEIMTTTAATTAENKVTDENTVKTTAIMNKNTQNTTEDNENKTSSSFTFTLKGNFAQIIACKGFLSQQLSGHATISIPILTQHLQVLEKQMHGSMKRLQDKYNVSLQLLSPTATSSNNNNHKTAAELKLEGGTEIIVAAFREVLKLLERYFPDEMAVYDLSSACQRECFDEEFVLQMEEAKVISQLYREYGILVLVGNRTELLAGKDIVENLKSQWEDCHTSIALDPSLVPALVGKGGTSINALRKETNASIEINTAGNLIDIKGSSKEEVNTARSIVEKRIHQLRAERWELAVSSDFFPILIGKQGGNINKMRTDTGANIDIDGNIVKVHGTEEKVLAAKTAILELLNTTEARQAGNKVISITPASIPVIIGTKGATIRELQEKTGVRFDFDRVASKCALKGSIEGVESALKLVNDLLASEGYPVAQTEGRPGSTPPASDKIPAESPTDPSEVDAENTEITATRSAKPLPGAPPSVLQRMQEKAMSKSALKRLRRKQAQENATSAGAADKEQEEDQEEDDDAPAAAPTVPADVLPQTLSPSAPLNTAASVSTANVTTASTPITTTEASASVPPKLGVIGKSSHLNASEVDSFRATEQSQDKASHPQPRTTTSSALPQHHQQQQLINLLLGDNSAVANLGMDTSNLTYASVPVTQYIPQQHQHYQAPPQYQQQYQHPVYQQHYQYSAPPSDYGAYQYGTQFASSQMYHQPSALYGRAGGDAAQNNHSNVIQPPGKSTQSRTTPACAPGMSIQTQQEPISAFAPPLLTPPPPGLTPPGGISSSRFTFAEYDTATSTSASITAPNHQKNSTEPYCPTATASNALDQQPFAVQYDNHTYNKQATSGNYYKSKSGFSVRL